MRGERPAYGAVARVPAPRSDGQALTGEEQAALHEALGPSFHLTETLPGTVPVFSGVPYMLVRGAPPAGTMQYLDGMPVPALHHLALGPLITHPSLLAGISFFPGVAPARYGQHTGAVVAAESARPGGANAGAVELRLLDTQGLLRAPEAGLGAHARYGYPDVMLAAIGSNAELAYWDYHLALTRPLGARDTLDVSVLGSGDRLGDADDPGDDIALQFHRARAAFEHELAHGTAGSALYVGYERGVLGRELEARQLRVGPSTFLELRRSDGTRTRVGAQLEARVADIDREPAPIAPASPSTQVTGPDAFLPQDSQGLELQSGPEDVIARTPLAKSPSRTTLGTYVELAYAPPDGVWSVEGGARADLYVIAGEAEQAFDPRMLVRAHATPELTLHAAAGTAHQGAVSPLPIAGLNDVELDRGVQSAVQTELGAKLELPAAFSFSITGFLHELREMVYLELIIDCEGNSDPLAPLLFNTAGRARLRPLCERPGLPRGRGRAYGAEVLLRRELSERFAGWLSYTLAWAEAEAEDGTRFVPQADVRHVLNAVLAQRWGSGWDSGVRVHYRSGKPAVNTFFDFTELSFERSHTRLPPFFRLDLSLAKAFDVSFGRLVATLELQNATFSREATKRDCRLDRTLRVVCAIDRAPAIVLPNVGLRAEL